VKNLSRTLYSTYSTALLLGVGLTACSSVKPADAANTPPPASHETARAHIQTLVFLDATGKKYTFGSHWKKIRPYVDYAIAGPQAINELHSLGIKTGFYVTVHTICDPHNYGDCQPEARTLPESAFIHNCTPPYGRVMWNPEASAAHPNAFYQYLGDVHSPELARSWNRFLDGHRQDENGPTHYDFAFEDNSMVPGDNVSWQPYYQRGVQAEQSPKPYCGYSNEQWMRDELHLENQAHYPLILNALNASDRRPKASYAADYLPKSKNAIGAMLEYVYGSTINGPDREKESDDIWRSEENSQLAMVNGRKLFVGYEHNGGNDPHALDVRGYQLASLLLSFDQRYVGLAQDGGGSRSGLALNPEIGFVAVSPLRSSPNSIDELKTETGSYVREFRSCSIWGKAIGPCAAIVNPSSTDAVKIPQLSLSYAHNVTLYGSGIIPGTDSGKISLTANNRTETLRPKEWRILAR
jgi:hypothetical protein